MILRSLVAAVSVILVIMVPLGTIRGEENVTEVWERAEARGKLNREALRRVDRVLQAWLKKINPETGLTPQRYDRNSVWTVANSAADLYSSLVLDAAFVDRDAMEGTLKRALETERKHAERIGRLPDDLNIHTLEFIHPEASLARSQYGASEWCRDGLRHYHDGSFGRTSVLFARLCSQGVRVEPWREDLCLGAVERNGKLYVWLHADRPWSGRLLFDFPRWQESLHLPVPDAHFLRSRPGSSSLSCEIGYDG